MNDGFSGSKIFLYIPIEISRDKDLLQKPKSILLMGEILSMINATGEFYMSNKEIAKRLDCSKVTVSDYLKLLEQKKLIKRKTITGENNAIVGRTISLGDALVKPTLQPQLSALDEGSKAHLTQPSKAHLTTLVKPALHKYNKIITHSNNTDKESVERGAAKADHHRAPEKSKVPYKKVIDYLNKKTGSHYLPTTKSYRSKIKARFNEGFTLQDFKAVIDKKCQEWLTDDRMVNYLRPETLFSTKFQSYLNQQVTRPRIRSQGQKVVEQGTDWSRKQAKTSEGDEMMSDAEMDKIFRGDY